MSDQVKLGIIQVIDRANRFGIIAEEAEGMTKSGGESVTFDLDDETQNLREGQLVQFLKETSNYGPRATRIAALTK